MPAAVAVPLITSAVGAGAGLLGQHKAGKAQEKARREAAAYESAQEAKREARRKEALDIYKNNYKAWLDKWGDKGLKRYGMPSGIDITKLGQPAAPAGQPPVAGQPMASRRRPGVLQPPMQRPAPADPNAGQGVMTLGNMLQGGLQKYGDYRAQQAQQGAAGGFGGSEFNPSKLKFRGY